MSNFLVRLKNLLGFGDSKLPEENQVIEAIKNNDLEALQRLVTTHNIPLNSTSRQGIHLLGYAAFYNKPDIIKFLASVGAKVDFMQKNGDTALMRACYYRRFDAARALLEEGADPNKRNNNIPPLLTAGLRGSSEMAELLIQFGADISPLLEPEEEIAPLLGQLPENFRDFLRTCARWKERRALVFLLKQNSVFRNLPKTLGRELVLYL